MKTIALSGKDGHKAIVDDDDYETFSKFKWGVLHGKAGHIYAVRWPKKGIAILMHREISNAPKGMVVDHINGNGLDNRKQNLRVCKHYQNLHNTERFNADRHKGVRFDKTKKKWVAAIEVNREVHRLGDYLSKDDAIAAYRKAADKFLGEFAFHNRERIEEKIFNQ